MGADSAQLLTHCPPHWGGLTPIANGLLHRWPGVRENTLELLNTMQQYAVCPPACPASLVSLSTD